jgi:hypothetical protein
MEETKNRRTPCRRIAHIQLADIFKTAPQLNPSRQGG